MCRKLNPSAISPVLFAPIWTSNAAVRWEDTPQSGFIVSVRGPREQQMSPNQWNRMKLAKKLESKGKRCNAHPCGECDWVFHPCPQHWLVPGMHTPIHQNIQPIHTCTHPPMPIYIRAGVHTCMDADKHRYGHIHMFLHIYVYLYIDMHIYFSFTWTFTCGFANTVTNGFTRTLTSSFTYYAFTCWFTNSFTKTFSHTHIHIHTHTYTRTRKQ